MAHLIQSFLFAFASFFGVVALAVDRFLAIHFHLRYQELVTQKRVVAVVFSLWVLSAFLSIPTWKWIPNRVLFSMHATINAFFLITLSLLYCKIYAAVRRHKNQIHALSVQVAEKRDMANAARLRKTAVSTVYVYAVFLACYVPAFCLFPVLSVVQLQCLLICGTMSLHLCTSIHPLIPWSTAGTDKRHSSSCCGHTSKHLA